MGCGLRRVSVWPQRNREIRLEVLDRNRLVIFDLEPLRAIRRNGCDARAKDGTAFRLLGSAFAHLEETGVDGLLLQLVVDFFGAFAFEDYGGQAYGSVPGGEIGDCRMAGKRENVIPFYDSASVI